MSRKTSNKRLPRQPSYRLHKARNCAVVTISGINRYLGPYDSPESHEKYARLIAEWKANGSTTLSIEGPPADGDVTINLLVLRFLEWAEAYYVKHGQPTGEVNNLGRAASALKQLYGRTPAKDFGPPELEAVQRAMIDDTLARKTINGRTSRIKRMFRWASRKGLVPPTTYHALLAVEGLKRGRTSARETGPVQIVPDEIVQATLPKLNGHLRAMVQIQELAAMRPQDIRNMRTADIDMTSDVWIYRPWTHKNEHHDQVREIAIGPRAQAILQPFLKPDAPMAYVFSPKDAVAAVRERRTTARKSKRTPSQLARKPKAKPKRQPRDQYDKNAYTRAVARACEKAKVLAWHPHQLRHNAATKIRRRYGLEGAMAVLGHKYGLVTEIYAERDLQKAIEIMREMG
jgi:integrase